MAMPAVEAVSRLETMRRACSRQEFEELTEEAPPAPEDMEAAPSREEREIFNALDRLHRRLGHPSQDQLLRVLRLAKIPSEVLDMAKRYECAACRRHERPKSVRQVGSMEVKEFNRVIGVDTLELHLP